MNNFVPVNEYDAGGISILKDNQNYSLYEYGNIEENKDYKYIRVTKMLDTYYGEGSIDKIDWINKGNRFIKNADIASVMYDGTAAINNYPINYIKIYKEPYWTIYGLNNEYEVQVYYEQLNKTYTKIVKDSDNIRFKAPYYPIKARIVIKNESGQIIVQSNIEEVWGGDNYYTSIDVDLFNDKMQFLQLEDSRYLGLVKSGEPLRKLIYIRNNTNTTFISTLRISKSSPAYDWVELEHQEISDKEINITLHQYETKSFYINIEEPLDIESSSDYEQGKNYVFYLEVL